MRTNLLTRRMTQAVLFSVFCLATLPGPAFAPDVPPTRTALDQGFHLLYDLDFDQARVVFLAWEHDHPGDPLGPTAEAAGLLFSEFHRLGGLEAQFYTNDKSFQARHKINSD